MENYIGNICPYCKTEIKEADAVKVCPACGIPHHENCWNENHGCTTFGCSGQGAIQPQSAPVEVQQEDTELLEAVECQSCGTIIGAGRSRCMKCGTLRPIKSICSRCGFEVGATQAFCPKCGTPKAAAPKKNICAKCGTELQDGQGFCPKCGQRAGLAVDANVNAAISQFNANITTKKKKSKALPIILAIVLVVAAIFGFVAYSVIQEQKAAEAAAEAERQRQEAIEEYIADAKRFQVEILNYGSIMEDIGNEIKTAWTAYVKSNYYNGRRYYSVNSAVEAAQSHEASNITKVKNATTTIDNLYRKLLTVPDPSNQELVEIKQAVKTAYDAYQEMYECIISPSGNYNTWTDEFHEVDSGLADAISDLRTLVS